MGSKPRLRHALYEHVKRLSLEALRASRVDLARLALDDPQGWRRAIRRAFLEAIGGLPQGTEALNPKVTGSVDLGDIVVEKVIFESLPKFYVTANLYLPKGPTRRRPAVLVPCGHSPNGKAWPEYQALCRGLARRGYVALTYDPIGQGERVEYLDSRGRPAIGPGTREHCHVGAQCLLVGWNLARFMVNDTLRALDYLRTRPEVDPERIAITGSSGGGTNTTYIACLDESLAGAIPTCYITSREANLETAIPSDLEQDLKGAYAKGLDQATLLAPFAPRPLLINAATNDFFPVEGAREAFERLKDLYRALGQPEKVRFFEAPTDHGYHKPLREATYMFLAEHLPAERAKAEEGREIPEGDLTCTKTGRVLLDFPEGVTVFDMVSERAAKLWEELEAKREKALRGARALGAFVKGIRAHLRELLSLPDWRERARLEPAEEEGGLIMVCPDGFRLPARFAGTVGASRMAVVASGDKVNDEIFRALEEEGYGIIHLHVRGTGPTRPGKLGGFPARDRYYGALANIAHHCLQLGFPLLGMRTMDVLSAVDIAARRARGRGVVLVGMGEGALPSLFSACLDHRVERLVIERPPLSFRVIAQTRLHRWHIADILPGALERLDVPDILASLAPRPCLAFNPLDGERRVASEPRILQEWRFPFQVYRALGAEDLFKVAIVE